MKQPNPKILLLSVAMMLALGCGKDVSLDGGKPFPHSGLPPVGPPSHEAPPSTACGPDSWLTWTFIQPQPIVRRAVDILIVVDTSKSLGEERSRIASTLPAFLQELHPETDYRVAVMLGHGGHSKYSGKLFAAGGSPKVLDSRRHGVATIQSHLRSTLSHVKADHYYHGNGEMLMYSLQKSLAPDHLAEIQREGFYRNDAALSVIFVTDENDVCFQPQFHGYDQFPDYAPSMKDKNGLDYEMYAYSLYCMDSSGAPAVSPRTVRQAFREFKKENPLSWGAIIHVLRDFPKEGEDAIGHGILQFVQGEANGVLIDIGQTSYSAGLAKLGNVVSLQQNLQTSFRLDGSQQVDPSTVRATVDGRGVPVSFDSGSRVATIPGSEAGIGGSVVQVQGCRQD